MKTKSHELLNELLEREGKVRMIRTKISGLVRENENAGKNQIFNFLNNLKNDYKDGVLPNKKNSPIRNKSLNFNNKKEEKEKEKCNTKTKLKEKKKENNKSKRSKSSINKNTKKGNKKDNKKLKNISNKFQDILNLFTNMKKDKDKIHDSITNEKDLI